MGSSSRSRPVTLLLLLSTVYVLLSLRPSVFLNRVCIAGQDWTASSFGHDGMPKYTTTWIPLTRASPTNSCLYVIPCSHDPGYHQGDKGKNPLSTILKEPESFQYIRALPCPAGSLIQFSHRLLHWGSAAGEGSLRRGLGEDPRLAISFASSREDFEDPYFSRTNLPYPQLDLRMALIAGLSIMYSQNEDPGKERISVYHDCFQACEDQMSEKFKKVVNTIYDAY
eukprot:m.321475 g.321475  ORF g.321475 m.321475 type:complete len:225 (-) comp16529_c1_seq5:80-754(-)